MAPAKKSEGSVDSSKPGKVPPIFEPLAVFFEKKVRNLEKRKNKLDSYRTLQKEGKLVDQGQKKAVDKYDECVASLAFASSVMQEILPTLIEINTGLEKAASEKEKEKDRNTRNMIRQILDYQDVYEQLGDESVRSHFASGARNATLLTENQLQTFDKLYLTSKPSRSNVDGTFKQKSEYVKALDDGMISWYRLLHKAGPIQGTDMKFNEMRALFENVSSCDYFDTPAPVDESPEEPAAEPVIEQPEEPVADVQPEKSFPVEPEETFHEKQPPNDYMATYQRRLVNFVQDEVPSNVDSFIGSPAEPNVAFNGGYQDNAKNNLPTRPLETEEIQQFGHFNGNTFANENNGGNEINNNFPIAVNNVSEVNNNTRGTFPPMESWADEAPEPFDPSLNSGSGDNMFVEVRRGGSGQSQRYGGRGGGMGYGRGGGGGSYRGDFPRGGGNRGNRNYDNRGYGRPYRGGDFRDDGQGGGGNFYNRGQGGGGQGGFMTKEFSSRGGGRGGKQPMRGGFDRNGMNNTASAGGRS